MAGSRHRGHPVAGPGHAHHSGRAEPQRRRLRRLRRLHLNQRRRLRLRRGPLRHLANLALHLRSLLLVPLLRVLELGPSPLELGLYGDAVGLEVRLLRLQRLVGVVQLILRASDGAEGDVALGSHLGADLRDGASDVLDEGVDDAVDVLHGGDESGAARGLARLAVHLVVLRRAPAAGAAPRARRWARAHPAASAVAPFFQTRRSSLSHGVLARALDRAPLPRAQAVVMPRPDEE